MSTVTRRFTADDLLTMPDGSKYELVNGELVEKPMSFQSDLIGGRVYYQVASFCEIHPVGIAVPETTYQCFPDDPEKVRRPDASFIRRARVPAVLPKGHCRIVPDLAVEVVSPGDNYSEVEKKVDEYLGAGVQLIWVIDPPTRSVRIHRDNGTVADIGPDGELSGEDVIPEFRCPVAALFQSSETKK